MKGVRGKSWDAYAEKLWRMCNIKNQQIIDKLLDLFSQIFPLEQNFPHAIASNKKINKCLLLPTQNERNETRNKEFANIVNFVAIHARCLLPTCKLLVSLLFFRTPWNRVSGHNRKFGNSHSRPRRRSGINMYCPGLSESRI